MCRRDKLCKTAIKSMVLSNHTLCGMVPITIYYSCPTLQHGKATPKYHYVRPGIFPAKTDSTTHCLIIYYWIKIKK